MFVKHFNSYNKCILKVNKYLVKFWDNLVLEFISNVISFD